MKKIDITGLVFSQLTVLSMNITEKGKAKWNCLCSCGNITVVYGYNLKNGHTTKCLQCAVAARGLKHRTHGESKSRLYKTYYGMIRRCELPQDKRYRHYGGKGITICDSWRENFVAFYEWSMNNGYKANLTIDRINVNGNYEPDNCRWANAKQQANNATTNHNITHDGKTQTIAQWADELGLKHSTLRMRLTQYAMPIELALSSKSYSNRRSENGK